MADLRYVCLMLLASWASTVPAMGQNALGGGNALDANPSATASRMNQASSSRFNLGPATPRSFQRTFSPSTDAQFRRNNIGDVGQRLVTESLYNNPWYWQNVGSLYTEMLTGGSGVASSLASAQQGQYNPFFYNQWATPGGRMRLSAGQRLTGIANPLDNPMDEPAPGGTGNVLQVPTGGSLFLQDDRMGSMLRSGRERWREGGMSRQAGAGLAKDERPIRYLLSPLRGVTMASQSASPIDIGLDNWDSARMFNDRMASRRIDPPGRAWNTRFSKLKMDTQRMEPETFAGSTPGLMRPTMQAVADRYQTLRQPAGSATEALDALDRQYQRMRTAVVRGGDAPLPDLIAQLDEEIENGTVGGQSPGEAGASASPGQDGETTELSTIKPLTPAEFGLIIKHDQRLTSLSSGDRTRFDDLVAAGEKALREGLYLHADRRFSRALRFVPGQPLATAGLVSSQVGGGLYLSAALTLKSLLGFEPMMIDMRFDAALLPREKELDRAISILMSRIQKKQDIDRYGLVLAWIGHQLDRSNLIETGLDAMRQSGRDPHFTGQLEQVWEDNGVDTERAEPARTPLKPVDDQ